jgi:hypothetical protein
MFPSHDPAVGKPLAVLWAYVEKTGHVHIYDEWPSTDFQGAKDDNIDVKGYIKIFREKEIHGPVQTRILDRHFGNSRRTLGGRSLKQEFSDPDNDDNKTFKGMDFSDSYTMAIDVEVETGIRAMKASLTYNKDLPVDNLNCPRLTISPKCKNTIKAMIRWGRNPKTGRPKEEFKDFADIVRYLVMAKPEIDAPEQQIFGNPTHPHHGVGNT